MSELQLNSNENQDVENKKDEKKVEGAKENGG